MTNIILGSWGQVANIVFVFISAWFLEAAQGIHLKKVLELILQTWFYCVVILLIAIWVFPGTVTIKTIIQQLLTPFYGQYWFITTYIVFYMLIPVLQFLIRKMEDKTLGKICLILTMIVPFYNFVFQNVGANLADFCYTFLLAAYLKRRKRCFVEQYCWKVVLGGCAIIILGILVGYTFFDGRFHFLVFQHLCNTRNLIIYFIAISLFFCFRKCQLRYHSYINRIAKATLGVYIIHENFLLSGGQETSLLWDGVFHMSDAFLCDWYPIYLIGVVFTVFVASTIIELIRMEVTKRHSILECDKIRRICMKFDNWWVVN